MTRRFICHTGYQKDFRVFNELPGELHFRWDSWFCQGASGGLKGIFFILALHSHWNSLLIEELSLPVITGIYLLRHKHNDKLWVPSNSRKFY